MLKINVEGRVVLNNRVPLANIGGLSLDLLYLGDLINEPRYRQTATGLLEYLRSSIQNMQGLYAEELELQLETNQPHGLGYSLGQRAGPAYEYLLKDTVYMARRDKRAQVSAVNLAKVSHERHPDPSCSMSRKIYMITLMDNTG